MQFINLNAFNRGAFENQGQEARIKKNFLLKAHNVTIDITGKIRSRLGYKYWEELLNANSITSSVNLPIIPEEETNDERTTLSGEAAGFQGKIQNVFQYRGVDGSVYNLIVSQGKIYVETIEENGKQWSILNPNETLQIVDKKINIVAYLDKLFFNDISKSVYFYDSSTYLPNLGWLEVGNSFAYFAGQTVYFRDFSDFSLDSSTLIEDGNVNNLLGQEIYDSLVSIGYIGPVIADETELNLGYMVRAGTIDTGIFYYVLDNGQDERVSGTYSIIKFDDKFLAVDFVEISDMDAAAEILNIAYHKKDLDINGYIYVAGKDGFVYKINESNMVTSRVRGDLDTFVAPTNDAGKKQYSLAVNDFGIFLYTVKLPDKNDWYQPLINGGLTMPGTVNPYASKGGDRQDFYSNPYNYLYNPFEDKYVSTTMATHRYGFPFGGSGTEAQQIAKANGQIQPNRSHVWGYEIDFQKLDTVYPTGKIHLAIPRLELSDWDNRKHLSYSIATVTFVFTDRFPLGHIANGFFVQKLGPGYDPGKDIEELQAIAFDFNAHTVDHHPDLAFDKEGDTIAGQPLLKNTPVGQANTAFHLNGTYFNPAIFSDIQTSDYTLVVGYDNTTGDLLSKSISTGFGETKNWKYVFPVGEEADLKNCQPMVFEEGNKLFFGNSMLDGANGLDNGKNITLDLDTWEITSTQSEYGSRVVKNHNDFRWTIFQEAAADIDLSSSKDVNESIYNANYPSDWTDFNTFNSNLNYHIQKQAVDFVGQNASDQIAKIGTPARPFSTLNYDAASTLIDGQQYRYRVAYQFFSTKTTELSLPSTHVQTSLNNKIVVSGLDLKDINGVDVFDTADIEFIQLYRQERPDGTAEWSPSTLIAILEQYDNAGVIEWRYDPPTNPYAAGVYEDSDGTPVLNPFDNSNKTEHKAADIFIHKNRLVLVNPHNNTIQYSDTDNAVAIPASNVRPIETGDGDVLSGGISSGNYAYLFKERKIYAILGDVFNGQPIDISRTIGTKYPQMKGELNGVVFFLNDSGIYSIQGAAAPVYLEFDRLQNYFDKSRKDSIDFDNLVDHGFVYVDTENQEIRFHVPQKNRDEVFLDANENVVARNNLVIIFNVVQNNFRTVSYADNISAEYLTKNISTGEFEFIIGTYEGDLFRISRTAKNDDGEPIRFIIRTIKVNTGSSTMRKIFKIIKIVGTYVNNLKVTYWIDGERKIGELFFRKQELITKIWGNGLSKDISIEITGESLNDPPTEIDELALGYDLSRKL